MSCTRSLAGRKEGGCGKSDYRLIDRFGEDNKTRCLEDQNRIDEGGLTR